MRRPLACVLAWSVAACAASSTASAPPPAGSAAAIVKGRFIGYALTTKSVVHIMGCRNAPGSERVRKDGSFELVALDCPPGIHRLVFGKDNAGLLKFAIRGPITDIGTIEGGR